MHIENIEKPKECERIIEITLPAKPIKEEIERQESKYSQSAHLKGFRKGKVPISLIKAKYGDAIKENVLNKVINKAYIEALKETKLQPSTKAEINILDFDDPDKSGQTGLRFKASFEIMPEIEIENYKGINLELPPIAASEKEIETELNNLRKQTAFYEPVVMRPAQMGDYLILNGELLQEEKGIMRTENIDNYTIILGAKEYPPELTNNLIGIRLNDRKKISFRYPIDWEDEKLRGKYVAYNVLVKEIKEKRLLPLDNEFAKNIGFQTFDELKDDIKSRIETHKQGQRKEASRVNVITKLINENPFELPERLKKAYIADVFEEFKDQELKDEDKKSLEDIGVWRAKRGIILDKIAGYEDIEVSDKDLKEELKNTKEAKKKGVEKVFADFKKNDILENIREMYKKEKVLDFLVENSIITEK